MDKTKTNKNFYKVLEETTRKLSTKDITIVVTDFNAKVGSDNTALEEEIGTNVTGSMCEDGELFASFGATYNPVTGGTMFPHKHLHLATWAGFRRT